MRQSPPPRHQHAVLPRLTEHRQDALEAIVTLTSELGRGPGITEIAVRLGTTTRALDSLLARMPEFVLRTPIRLTPEGVAALESSKGKAP